MQGLGIVVDLGGGTHLLELALVHDHDPVGEAHGLLLVVGDEDDRDAQVALDLLQLLAHLLADLGVQGGEGLVEKQQGGLQEQGAGNGDTLLLAAGELAGILLFRAAHADQGQAVLHGLVDLGLGDLAQLQAEGQVFINGHVGPEVIALEYHGRGALFGGQVDDGLTVHGDVALGHVQKAADGAQDRSLAAAGGAQEGDDLALVDLQINVPDTVSIVIELGHVLYFKLDFPFVTHGSSLLTSS